MQPLIDQFGDRIQINQSLSRYTASRIGGLADALFEVRSVNELVEAATICWQAELPFIILGGGSNVLVSDKGVRGLILVNRARDVKFETDGEPRRVWAELGVNLGKLARLTASKGLAGLEWAAGIPGTLGGAVVGNAGAHGSDMAATLQMAEILHHHNLGEVFEIHREQWMVGDFSFAYRSSVLKNKAEKSVVLSAWLTLQQSTVQTVQARIDELTLYRKKTQPPGASMGSMFKNPPGDYAGRLIEAVGLKGKRSGGAQISPLHANFFINEGNATAGDVYDLICKARQRVDEEFGINLELEVGLIGEW